MRIAFLGALPVLLLIGCASTSPGPDGQDAYQQTTEDTLLEQGLEVLLKDRFPRKAIDQYFDKVIESCPSPSGGGSRVYAARSLMETIAYMAKAAADKAGEAYTIGPNCAYAHFYKGYALLDLGQVERAKPSIRKAIEFSPYNSGFHSELGHIYQLDKDWEQALAEYSMAEEYADFSPEDVRLVELSRAKRGVGFVLIEQGKLDEAAEKFRECLELDPKDAKAQNELDYIAKLRDDGVLEEG